MAVLTRGLLCLAAVVLAAGCRMGAEQWGPFRGQVVDGETGRPIAGAHVMFLWLREPPSLHITQSFYDAQETTTDANGRFEVPRRLRWFTAFVNEPYDAVFAPGYQMQEPQVTPAGGRMYVEPTTVRMRPLKTRDEQCKFEPSIHVAVSRSIIPQYASAVDAYVDGLRCSRSS